MIFSRPGVKNLILFRGYTFSRRLDRNWYCSKAHSGCKSKLYLNKCNEITYFVDDHNHEPPRYHITSKGDYMKI